MARSGRPRKREFFEKANDTARETFDDRETSGGKVSAIGKACQNYSTGMTGLVEETVRVVVRSPHHLIDLLTAGQTRWTSHEHDFEMLLQLSVSRC